MCRDANSEARLAELRRLYEPWAQSLSRHFYMPLPPWLTAEPHKDNWQTVAKLRATAEESNPDIAAPTPTTGETRATQALELLHDDHHDF
jgi:hypothetical protein